MATTKTIKLVVGLLLTFCLVFKNVSAGRNGGVGCIACTIAVGLTEELAQYYNETVSDALSRICDALPAGKYQSACHTISNVFGPLLIDVLFMKETPDVICSMFSLCYTSPGTKQCHLYPPPLGGFQKSRQRSDALLAKLLIKHNMIEFPDLCKIEGINLLCDIYNRVEEEMLPAFDFDNDFFGTFETLRGSNWRGKDCNDMSWSTHPGAKPIKHDIEEDSNCNGIYGVDKNGIPYEDLLCSDTQPRGIAILGDSVSAHFHIPPEWVMPSKMTPQLFTHFPYWVENELDWPMMSYITGFKNITWPIIQGPTRSVYMKLRDHNLCNHRDFQNLAVNGADSFNLQKYQLSLARNNDTDNPLLVAIALVGNDVCNKFDDTVAHMTTPQQMYNNIVKTLTFLNERVPKGSHVVMTGLADGRYLYGYLNKRVHPLGNLNKDVTYPALYSYLNCLNISPCSGWMTTNGTVRNMTAQRVAELNKAIAQVAIDYKTKFSQFDVSYLSNPVDNVIVEWEKKHGPGSGYELIEPMDGFHPNQYAQALIGDYIWDYMVANLTEFIGKPNPNNWKIKEIFGDQGGYD